MGIAMMRPTILIATLMVVTVVDLAWTKSFVLNVTVTLAIYVSISIRVITTSIFCHSTSFFLFTSSWQTMNWFFALISWGNVTLKKWLSFNKLVYIWLYIPACSSLTPHWIGGGWCEDENNNADCGFDGGDCCGPDVKTLYCTECECLGENITSKAAPGPFCSCSAEGVLDCKLLIFFIKWIETNHSLCYF